MEDAMTTISPETHVATIAREQPATIKVFQRHGIDFCCGGKRPLAEVAAAAGVPAAELLAELRAAAAGPRAERDWGEAPLGELVDHILERYHLPLQRDLPVLLMLAAKVATRHGDTHPELVEVRHVVEALATEMSSHMQKEERVLFPMISRLAAGGIATAPVDGPIEVMELEHEQVARLLSRLRQLTGGFAPPAEACNSYRGLFTMLAELESETVMHVHLENNVLFARVEELAAAV
jgi:regulator of cell morphogenesis and NO signaling